MISFTNAAGALVSLALVVGIGIWGYKLLVRDVSGIPVVRAAEGDMRVRPEDPGGQLAQNQGLSVNAVAAEGAAAAPADQLRLAPRPVDLTAEDQIVPAAMVAPTPQVAAPATPDITAALQSGNVEELVAQLTDGIAPLTETPVTRDTSVAALVESAVAEALEDAPQPVTVAAAVLDALVCANPCDRKSGPASARRSCGSLPVVSQPTLLWPTLMRQACQWARGLRNLALLTVKRLRVNNGIS
ncbi:hypothetical protein [Sulfitobacter aestuariivivens]|uniref:hypothetical protein n=1 Tax=Sulfitobacter aestuariivivens TaxID=2766981 RepID=UPI00360C8358